MIAMQNIIDHDKSLLTIIFNNKVLKHLKCKCNDYLIFLQSHVSSRHFIVAKSDTGYRIRRYTRVKKTYQINVGYNFNFLSEFDFMDCTYYLKPNGTIRIVLSKYQSLLN